MQLDLNALVLLHKLNVIVFVKIAAGRIQVKSCMMQQFFCMLILVWIWITKSPQTCLLLNFAARVLVLPGNAWKVFFPHLNQLYLYSYLYLYLPLYSHLDQLGALYSGRVAGQGISASPSIYNTPHFATYPCKECGITSAMMRYLNYHNNSVHISLPFHSYIPICRFYTHKNNAETDVAV